MKNLCYKTGNEPESNIINKMTSVPSNDSDQPGHLPRLIIVLAVRMKMHWILSYPKSAQLRCWSDWAVTQADLSLHWAHKLFCWFRCARAQMCLRNDSIWHWAASWQNQQNGMCTQQRQISLGIRPVWSESSLSAWRKLESLATHWVHSKDSDQTGRMPRLIWVFAGRTLILWVFLCRGSYCVEVKMDKYINDPTFPDQGVRYWYTMYQ